LWEVERVSRGFNDLFHYVLQKKHGIALPLKLLDIYIELDNNEFGHCEMLVDPNFLIDDLQKFVQYLRKEFVSYLFPSYLWCHYQVDPKLLEFKRIPISFNLRDPKLFALLFKPSIRINQPNGSEIPYILDQDKINVSIVKKIHNFRLFPGIKVFCTETFANSGTKSGTRYVVLPFLQEVLK
jgi:hypothetical protein